MKGRYAHLHRARRQPILNSKVQARLALRHERQPRIPHSRIRDEPRQYSSPAHLALLNSLPSVGMRKHEVNITLDRCPQIDPIGVGVRDVARRAVEQVREKVREHLDNGLVQRQRVDVARNFYSCPRANAGPQVKLKPEKRIRVRDLGHAAVGRPASNAPFGLHPLPVLSLLVDALAHRLRTHGLHVATAIIVDDRWDLGRASDVFVRREPTSTIGEPRSAAAMGAGERLPRNTFDFWDLPWVKDARCNRCTIRIVAASTQPDTTATYLYDIPLYVVPTSKARTSFRRGPLNAGREVMEERRAGKEVPCGARI